MTNGVEEFPYVEWWSRLGVFKPEKEITQERTTGVQTTHGIKTVEMNWLFTVSSRVCLIPKGTQSLRLKGYTV